MPCWKINKRLRPGDIPTKETARTFFDNLFFNAKRYDLSRIGRLKLNTKLGLDLPLEIRMLTRGRTLLRWCVTS